MNVDKLHNKLFKTILEDKESLQEFFKDCLGDLEGKIDYDSVKIEKSDFRTDELKEFLLIFYSK